MRVALGQLDMVWEDREASIVKAEQMIKEAAGSGCDVIVFPEMSFVGFSMDVDKIAETEGASETEERMKALAKKYKIAIAYGWVTGKGKKKGKNRFRFLDEKGKCLGDYVKIHPFTYGGEADHYEKGEHIVVFSYKGREIALFICYDLRFPEIFQIASKRAEVIFVIANWPASRISQWEVLLRARAIETQSYVVGVNCVGDRDNHYTGSSMAVDCMGKILGKLASKEGILVCDLEDRARHLREKFDIKSDRRQELYQRLGAAK